MWEVEYTDEFEAWWDNLTSEQQADVEASVRLLETEGPTLRHPFTSQIKSSKHGRMRELRVQSEGRPLRVFYAFDLRRIAILLVAGDKTGDDRFYDRLVPIADRLYEEHLTEIDRETS